MGAMRAVGAAAIVAAALMTAGPAAARPPAPLGLGDCEQVQDVYQCSGLVETWDGVPLDTTVTVPAARARHLPLVAELHGFGNSKYEYLDPSSTAYTGNAYDWALIGRLVDEGVADRRRIGVTGDSYGGGQSFELAALRDRMMLPSGRLVRWRSPDGTPLRIAAAAPVIPWTDLVYAAAPNGRTPWASCSKIPSSRRSFSIALIHVKTIRR